MSTARQSRLTRREFLRWMGLGTAAAAVAACAPKPAPAPAPTAPAAEGAATTAPEAAATTKPTSAPPPPTATAVPTAAPRLYGEGGVEIVVWYQDWDGANRIMNWAAPKFLENHPGVTINLQAIGYSDLFAKLLPSIAAGTEGDVMMAYTDWVVATDVKQVFLDMTEAVGGASAIASKLYPAALNMIDVPEGRVMYLPWLAGIRGAVQTVNTAHMAEQGIDYLNFKSYEELVDAGVKLTQWDGDRMVRAGYSPRSSQYQVLWSLIWQLGGDFFDRETGKWSHNSEEGEMAAQMIYDLYWTQKTCDFSLFTSEYEAVSQQLVSIWGDGAWTLSVQSDVADVPCDNIVTPPLANAKENVLYPQHAGVWGLSRRLAQNNDKLKTAVELALFLVGPEASVQLFDFYSGVCMSKETYESPEIENAKYGPVSKRIAEALWPVARWPQDHVANHAPASTELDRAMRNEITIREALASMDAYLQEQEDAARERIGLA